MTPAALLDRLHALGATVSADGDTLHIEAPRGALTPDLVADLRSHKPELLALLTRCDRCGARPDRLVPAYWGDRYCPACCPAVAADLDARDAWPPVPSWEQSEVPR